MIIVRIVGGLGNQMFLYAYAKALQERGLDVKIDISKFKKYKLHGGYQLDKYNIDLKVSSSLSNLLAKLGFLKSIKETSLLFDPNLKSLGGNKYIKGYFQTEKYFSEIRTVLLEQFNIKQETSSTTSSIAKDIVSHKNSCSLHIRRGDYISNDKTNSIHGICSLDYYQNAMNLINTKYEDVRYFIFSDDISWVKENLKIKNAFYIDHKTIPHEDIYLMSLCQHNITANSSFSWWGAWLNKNSNKTVIAPKLWFVDKKNEIASENWIKI